VNVISGEAAALGTAVCWAVAYVFFTLAVRRIGARALNRLRLVIALGFLTLLHLLIYREPFPFHAELSRWAWLSLSGAVGFALADAMLFRALFYIGAHRTSLVMALVPVFSTLLAWGIFKEVLTIWQSIAIVMTLAGIGFVVWEPGSLRDPVVSKRILTGVVFALGAAAAQALRYIFSKEGMGGDFPVLSTNVIQILAATVILWTWALLRGQMRATVEGLRHPRARWATMGGAVAGPFAGVTLSLVALKFAPVGVASTLMALPPVLLLPLSCVVFKESIRGRALIGTTLAVAGVAMLFLF
jgi:drug/metabolite transporter (DMT)-like permease